MIHKSINPAKQSSGRDASTSGTFFLSLDVESVKCFGDEVQKLDLSDGRGNPASWSVLLGENGTGKTTVLQLLAGCVLASETVQDDEITGIPYLIYGRPKSDLVRLSRNGKARITAGLVRGKSIKSCAADPGLISIREDALTVDAHSTWGFAVTRVAFKNSLVCAYSANRHTAPASLTPEPNRGTATLRNIFDESSSLRNAEEWLLQRDYAALKSPSDRRRRVEFDRVQQVLIDILPDVDRIRIDNPSFPDGQQALFGSPVVLFNTPYGEVNFASLSLGYRTQIAWMVDFASRMFDHYPDSPDPLAEPAICLVDEIDLHLHPTWQRTLMTYLSDRFPNTQFIVTAHSPLVVQAAASVNANLALFKRVGDHVEIKNDVDEIKGWRIDQILTSELFDLPTARPPDVEHDLARRKELLSKPKLTAKDKRELEKLNKKVHDLPIGDTADDVKRLSKIIADASDVLRSREKRK